MQTSGPERQGALGVTSRDLINRAGIFHSITHVFTALVKSQALLQHPYSADTALALWDGCKGKKKSSYSKVTAELRPTQRGPAQVQLKSSILRCVARSGVAKSTVHSQSCFPTLQHPSARWDLPELNVQTCTRVEMPPSSPGSAPKTELRGLSGTRTPSCCTVAAGMPGVLWQACIES